MELKSNSPYHEQKAFVRSLRSCGDAGVSGTLHGSMATISSRNERRYNIKSKRLAKSKPIV